MASKLLLFTPWIFKNWLSNSSIATKPVLLWVPCSVITKIKHLVDYCSKRFALQRLISEVKNTQVDNAKDIDIVIPMYNLIEYSNNYSKTSGSLWQYCKDTLVVNSNGDIVDFNGANATDSFNFNAKITGWTDDDGEIDNVEILVPLKYFLSISNFWRTLEMPLINCEVNLTLTWSANCGVTLNQGTTFKITKTILYAPVVTLSTQGNAKLLAQLKSGFKRTISWNKYLSKPELLRWNPNLNNLVEPSFQGVNRIFVLVFQNDAQRRSNKRYYLPNVEIKDYSVMIGGKNFFDQPVKNNKVTWKV